MATKLKVKRHSDTAKLPERKSALAAGYDLCADEECVILPGDIRVVSTNISVEIPSGHYGRIAPRSGIAIKNGINVLAGVIDADYRGILGVVLINHERKHPFSIGKGDRIAQLVLERHSMLDIEEACELSETARGEGGFGSTGTDSKDNTENAVVSAM